VLLGDAFGHGDSFGCQSLCTKRRGCGKEDVASGVSFAGLTNYRFLTPPRKPFSGHFQLPDSDASVAEQKYPKNPGKTQKKRGVKNG
jgi:hypothetical protein